MIPECSDFHGRMTTSHQNNASDPVNLSLNYPYGVLQGECRAAINTVGLEPFIGFLHVSSDYQTKQSLVYDLQEPFRWIADVAVMEAFESQVLDLPDFYFTGDDYPYRFEPEAKQRFLDLLREQSNSAVRYKGRAFKWGTVIEQKAVELGRFLTNKRVRLTFDEPSSVLAREDSRELRAPILSLRSADAKQLEIGRSTLHYLHRRATRKGPFKIYRNVRNKLGGQVRTA